VVTPRCAVVAATPFALKMQAKPPSEMMVASAEGARARRSTRNVDILGGDAELFVTE
jgi:hypothetical protein